MTEDHKVRCSIHLLGAFFSSSFFPFHSRTRVSRLERVGSNYCFCSGFVLIACFLANFHFAHFVLSEGLRDVSLFFLLQMGL